MDQDSPPAVHKPILVRVLIHCRWSLGILSMSMRSRPDPESIIQSSRLQTAAARASSREEHADEEPTQTTLL